MLKKVFYIDPKHAKLYGFEEAAILSHIIYWISFNKKSGSNNHDGKTWTYNTYKAYSDFFEFWSEKQVRRMLANLVEKGALITGNYNDNPFNKTVWYALCDESQTEESIILNGNIDLPKRADVHLPKRATHIYRTDINTDETITDILPLSTPKPEETLFKHWNLKSPKTHKSLSEAAAANIKKLLLTHSVEDLKSCIDNYSSVVTSKTSWYTYKSIIEEFFRPGKLKPAPYIRFLPDNFIPDNYKAKDTGTAANQGQSHTEVPQSTIVPVTVIISRIAKYFPDGIDYLFFPPQSDEKKWNEIYNRLKNTASSVKEITSIVSIICKELENAR